MNAPPLFITPPDGSALAILQAQYADAKAAADEAAARLKAITDGIKNEMYRLANGDSESTPDTKMELAPAYGPALRLSYVFSNRFSTPKFRADFPELADKYTTQSGAWVLTQVKSR